MVRDRDSDGSEGGIPALKYFNFTKNQSWLDFHVQM
jgi:hypothetical protein